MTHLTSASLVTLGIALCFAPTGAAQACSPGAYASGTFEVDADAFPDDVTPPSAIGGVSADVVAGFPNNGCDDCGELPGRIHLLIEPPEDDQAELQDIGYRITLVEGTFRQHWDALATPLAAERFDMDTPEVVLSWDDDGGARGIDVVFEIAAIDRAGNVGPATRVPVRAGAGDPGCSAVSRSETPVPVVAIMVLLLGLGRLRRRA